MQLLLKNRCINFKLIYITDINGQRIRVTNLEDAISQASMFSSMKHEDASFSKLDDKRRIYWQDILNKLQILKK